MQDKEFDVFGIGSPLIDIYMESEDHHLIELKLNKGHMHLLDNRNFLEIQKKLKTSPIKTGIAGDVTNTMMGIAAIGGRSVFCGKVGNGKYADLFEEVLASDNIKPVLVRCNRYNTGRVISFVTKDGQRTMTTYLGAAVGLKREEVVLDDIKRSKFLYTSGYVLDSPDLRVTMYHAMDIAKENGVKIAFDMADPGVIERNRREIQNIIENYADVIFANEIEAEKYTGKKPDEAVKILGKNVDIAVVKVGEGGSYIRSKEKSFKVDITPIKAVDSTGAGDLYAAGFLYALARGSNVNIAANVASFVSSNIVKQYGTRLEVSLKEQVETMIEGKIKVETIN